MLDRADADVVLALALVHHLAIGRNVPLPGSRTSRAPRPAARSSSGRPKDDPMVRTLLATREDVFDDYTMDGFRTAFDGAWEVDDEAPVSGTPRTLFRMARRP